MAVHVRIEVNQDRLAEVLRDLQMDNPAPTVIVSYAGDARMARISRGTEHRGRYNPDGNIVRVVNTHDSIRNAPLATATRQATFTLLHELRHHWQNLHWDEVTKKAAREGAYSQRMEEIDANDFAAKNLTRYPGLVRIHRESTRRTRRLP